MQILLGQHRFALAILHSKEQKTEIKKTQPNLPPPQNTPSPMKRRGRNNCLNFSHCWITAHSLSHLSIHSTFESDAFFSEHRYLFHHSRITAHGPNVAQDKSVLLKLKCLNRRDVWDYSQKLLFCLCNNVWETRHRCNDKNVLNEIVAFEVSQWGQNSTRTDWTPKKDILS